MMTESRQILRLTYRLALFFSGAWLLLFVAGWGFDHFVDWRSAADPRHKILWHPDPDGSKIVLLGDSVFCSNFVDSADRMLAARLASLTGLKTFQGALNGAKEDDFRAAVRTVSDRWPAGTTVFFDVIPSRFGIKRQGEDTVLSNYQAAFKRITRVDENDFESALNNNLLLPLRRSLFLLSNQEVVRTALDRLVRKRTYFRVGEEYNRVWYQGSDKQARIGLVVVNLIEADTKVLDFGLLQELQCMLSSKGIKLVFVLTPYGREIVDRFEPPQRAQHIHQGLTNVHTQLKYFLERNAYDYIDLYDKVPSEGFANLVHLNETGEGILANEIAAWIAESGIN